MTVCDACSGVLRKLKYTWLDKHTLHKKTICNDCGMINEWDQITTVKQANKRFFHPVYTKGSYVTNEPVKIIKDCGCK